MTRPDWEHYLMGLAVAASARSACERLQVGCVLTRDRRVLATGMNGWVAWQPHISVIRDNHEQATLHAEQNAICQAARHGVNVDGATAYVTHFPCLRCAMLLCAAGIVEVVYMHDYKNDPLIAELLPSLKIRKLI